MSFSIRRTLRAAAEKLVFQREFELKKPNVGMSDLPYQGHVSNFNSRKKDGGGGEEMHLSGSLRPLEKNEIGKFGCSFQGKRNDVVESRFRIQLELVGILIYFIV